MPHEELPRSRQSPAGYHDQIDPKAEFGRVITAFDDGLPMIWRFDCTVAFWILGGWFVWNRRNESQVL